MARIRRLQAKAPLPGILDGPEVAVLERVVAGERVPLAEVMHAQEMLT